MKHLLALAMLCTGCVVNFEETTFVRVRNASTVAVGAYTENEKSEQLLDAEGATRRAEVPPTRPPFTELIRYASVERRGIDEVVLACPSCGGPEESAVIPYDGTIALAGSPDDTLVRSPDALGMRWSREGLFRCRRGGGLCPRKALSLWLATPASNVVEIRYRKTVATGHGERIGAWVGTIVGSLFFAGGIALGVGSTIAEGRPGPGLVVGGSFTAIGGFFATVGVLGLLAKDSEVTIPP